MKCIYYEVEFWATLEAQDQNTTHHKANNWGLELKEDSLTVPCITALQHICRV